MSHWSNSAPARRLAPFLQAATDNIYIQSHLCVTLMCNRIQPPAPSHPLTPLPPPLCFAVSDMSFARYDLRWKRRREHGEPLRDWWPAWAGGSSMSYRTIRLHHRMLLHRIIWYCVVLCSIVWYCVVLYDIVWHCMVLYGIVWYRIVSYGVLNELSDHRTLWRLSTTTPSPWLSERRGKVSEDTKNEKRNKRAKEKFNFGDMTFLVLLWLNESKSENINHRSLWKERDI